jgi:NADPH2:quinone reductase
MHAIEIAEFGDPSVLRWVELPDPVPGPDQVAIKVSRTNVNFADTLLRRGSNPGLKRPYIPGLDCTGVITALGANVQGLKVGQRVTAFADGGSYAEIVVARAVLTYAIPDGVADDDVCGLVALVTAWNAIHLAGRLASGETLLVHSAAGGVGLAAIQIARRLGAKTIIGLVSDLKKAEIVRECGADHVLEAKDFAAGTRDTLGGPHVDVILDPNAGESFLRNFDVLAPFGRLVSFGQAAGAPAMVGTELLHPTNRAVIGYSSGHYRAARPAALRPAADGVIAAIQAGDLRLVIGARFPLREAAEAHRLIESRKSHGKILLTP